MEIPKSPLRHVASVETPETLPSLQEARNSRRGNSAQPFNVAETDDYAGDADEIESADSVSAVTQAAKDMLENKILDGKAVGGLIDVENPTKRQKKKLNQVSKHASELGLTDLQVVVVPEYFPTILHGAEGTRGIVTLKPRQEYKTRKIDGQFILVISEKVSLERAAEITSDFIANKIARIAKRVGLRPKFDGIFLSLLDAGQTELVNLYSSAFVPMAESSWHLEMHDRDRSASDIEEKFRRRFPNRPVT